VVCSSSNRTVSEAASITGVKGDHVEHLNTMFNVTALHCSAVGCVTGSASGDSGVSGP